MKISNTKITSTVELANVIEKQIYTWLEAKATLIKKQYIEEFLNSEFYSLFTPKEYSRSYQIISSAVSTNVKKVGGFYEIEVYLDDTMADYQDETIDVWSGMASGLHGWTGVQTDGRFWEELQTQLGHGGKYDLYADFKMYLGGKGNFKIK